MVNRRFAVFAALAGIAAVMLSSPSIHARSTSASAASEPQLIDDASLKALSVTIGGADVLPTTRTIPHWWGSSLDPHNGVTYGYNMVGANPYACSGSACSVTIETDITPIIVRVGGRTYDGYNVLAATLASPQFEVNDYGSTPFATAGAPNVPRGPGGLLSQVPRAWISASCTASSAVAKSTPRRTRTPVTAGMSSRSSVSFTP